MADGARTFNLPEYRARILEMTLDKATGVVSTGTISPPSGCARQYAPGLAGT